MHLHAAAQDLHQIRDNIALEDPGIVGLQAVEDLAPDGHQPLELRIPALLAGTQSGVALHDVDLPLAHVLGAAVHELLHPVGNVDLLRQLLFLVDTGLLRRFPAALINQHLVGDLVRGFGIFDEVHLQLLPEEVVHGVLNEFVGDGLLGLIFVAGLGGEIVADQDQAVLHIGIGDLRLVLGVLPGVLQILVDGVHKGQACGLFRGAAVLQEAGVVVMLHQGLLVGKAAGYVHFHLIFGLVLPVTAPAFTFPTHRLGKGVLPCQLPDVVGDAVFIEEILTVEGGAVLTAQAEGDPGVHHGLPLHYIPIVRQGDVDVREHIQIRQPVNAGAGLALLALRQGTGLQITHDLAFFKVQGVFFSLPPDGDVHVAAGILGGAGAQAVETQGKLVVFAVFVVIFAAGVQLAEHQLPVEAAFLFVPVHRAATAHVLHLNGEVGKSRHGDEPPMALPGLVNGVGQYFKYGVLAALQAVGAEDDPRTLAHTIRTLETGNAFVVVVLFRSHIALLPAIPTILHYFTVFFSFWQVLQRSMTKRQIRGENV